MYFICISNSALLNSRLAKSALRISITAAVPSFKFFQLKLTEKILLEEKINTLLLKSRKTA